MQNGLAHWVSHAFWASSSYAALPYFFRLIPFFYILCCYSCGCYRDTIFHSQLGMPRVAIIIILWACAETWAGTDILYEHLTYRETQRWRSYIYLFVLSTDNAISCVQVLKHGIEAWNWTMKLKCGIKACGIEPWNWSVELKHEIEAWIMPFLVFRHWYMELKRAIEAWNRAI